MGFTVYGGTTRNALRVSYQVKEVGQVEEAGPVEEVDPRRKGRGRARVLWH